MHIGIIMKQKEKVNIYWVKNLRESIEETGNNFREYLKTILKVYQIK